MKRENGKECLIRAEFVDEFLGTWSSHPRFLRKRSWLFLLCSLAPLGGGIALYALAWNSGVVDLASMLTHWQQWLPLALALVVCGFTFLMTSILCLRLSTVPHKEEPCRPTGGRDLWRWILGAAGVGLAAFLLTVAAPALEGLGATFVQRVAWIGHILGTVPLLAIVFIAEHQGVPVDKWGTPGMKRGGMAQFRRWFLFSFVLSGCLLPMLWLEFVVEPMRAMVASLLAMQLMPTLTSMTKEFGAVPGIVKWIPFVNGDSLATALDSIAAMATLMPLFGTITAATATILGFKMRAKEEYKPAPPSKVLEAMRYHLRPAEEARGFAPESEHAGPYLWHRPKKASLPDSERPWWSLRSRKRALESPDGPKTSASEATPSQRQADGRPNSEAESTQFPGDASKSAEIKKEAEFPEYVRARTARCKGSVMSEPRNHVGMPVDGAATEPTESWGTMFLLPEGAEPTNEQLVALERFDGIHEEMLSADDIEGRGVLPASDMLVCGPRGSGRTTFLMACAMHSAALRGQSVLYLCKSRDQARDAVRGLRELAARCGLGWFLSIVPLERDDVVAWTTTTDRPDDLDLGTFSEHIDPRGAIPDIIVGTPEDFERFCYGAEVNTATMRRALVRLQVLLIEDLSMFRPLQQRHLPFLIDKHKLLLGTERAPVQCVAVIPELSDGAAEALGARLFSEREQTHFVRLGPVTGASLWIVDVEAESPEEEFFAQIRDCGQASSKVIAVHPKRDDETWKILEAKVKAIGVGATLVADLDAITHESASKAAALVMLDLSDGADLPAVLSRLRNSGMMLVRIVPQDKWAIERNHKTVLPVFPGPHSPALSIGHLRSAIHFLAPFTPVPRDLWARAGLGASRAMVGIPVMEPDYQPLLDFRLRLDPPEHLASGEAASRGLTWSWVALEIVNPPEEGEPAAPAAHAVEFFRPLKRNLAMRKLRTDDGVVFGERSVELEDQSIVDWVTHKGESLGTMDLAYSDNLLHEHGKQRFFPASVREQERRFIVTGSCFQARGLGESYLPAWHCRISLPAGLTMLAWPGACRNVRLYSLEAESIARPVAQARMQWIGDFDEIGNPRKHPQQVDVVFESGGCALFLNPSPECAERPSESLAGVWTTCPEREPVAKSLPILGMSIQRALRRVMPTLFNYCRLVAFESSRMERQSGTTRAPAFERATEASAVLFFIEPFATRGTAQRALHTLLNDAPLTLAVFQDALSALKAVQSDSSRGLPRLQARAGYSFGDPLRFEGEAGHGALALEVAFAMSILGTVVASLERSVEEAAEARRFAALNPAGPSMA